MSSVFKIQINGCDAYPTLNPDHLTGQPTLDRGTTIQKEVVPNSASTTTMPQSHLLLKSINYFTQHSKFPSFTQNKIQDVFAKFVDKIKNLESQEGPNAILQEAQQLIATHQKRIEERNKTRNSELLFKQIETFTQHPSTLSLTQEKIQKTYEKFVARMQSVEKEEGPNHFLDAAHQFIKEYRESTIKKGKELVETAEPHSPEEDKLFKEIRAFLDDSQTSRLSAEKLEQHLKDYESRLAAINDRPADPSFGYKIKSLFVELRARITNTRLIHHESSAPSLSSVSMTRSSGHNVQPSLRAAAEEIHNIIFDLVNDNASLQALTERLIKLDTQMQLQIGDEMTMMPIGGLVFYHLTLILLGKNPLDSQINDPEYVFKAFADREGCTATIEERTRALLRAKADILIQGYRNSLKQKEISRLQQYCHEVRELAPVLAALGDAIPELETFGHIEGKNTVVNCMKHASDIRRKLKVQWNIV